jgi:hypothetical protein
MKERIECKYKSAIFSDCIGIVDGTLTAFSEQPSFDGMESVTYFSIHKQAYGLQLTLICDDQPCIQAFHCGSPASVHDACVFTKMEIHQHLSQFFHSYSGFLLADTAYPISPCCITPFKKPCLGVLTQDQKKFNT